MNPQTAVTLRAFEPADGAGLARLIAESPDTGRVSVSPHFHVPIDELMSVRHPGSVGVVARTGDGAVPAGAAWVSFERLHVGGRLTPVATLHSLVVHPDHRRHGVATAMTRWRLDRIDEWAPETVVLAGIQAGNVGSVANARMWATQVIGKLIISPVPMRSRPPRMRPGLTVREPHPDELATVAAGLARFQEGWAIRRLEDGDSIRTWLGQSLAGAPIHRYLVAVDAGDQILAGLGLTDEPRFTSLHVSLPRPLRLANRISRVVPRDGVMRTVPVTRMWFAPGQAAAAAHLWETVRWTWRDRGTSLITTLDDRNPIRAVMSRSPLRPTTSLSLAVRAPDPVEGLLDAPL